MHLSSASPRGGPRANVRTLLIVHFKVLVFPHPWGNFFLQSPQYLAKPSTQLDLKMHFRTLFWFFEQLANSRTLNSDENWTLIIFSWVLRKLFAVWWKFQLFFLSWIPQILFQIYMDWWRTRENTLSWWFIAASKHNVLKFPEYSGRLLWCFRN